MRTKPYSLMWVRSLPSASMQGFTLIELMISVTVGLAILAGLIGVLSSNAGNVRTNERTSELMTNGRYALNAMKAELREAGFRGYTYAEPGTPMWTGAYNPPNMCAGGDAGATGPDFVANVRQGVWGSNNVNPFSTNCIVDANYVSGTDVLVIRHLAATPITGALVANTVYFQSTYERGQVFRSTSAPTGVMIPQFAGSLPLGSFEVRTYVYYISPWTISAAESPAVPSLRRMSLQSDGTMQSELVASGIERMQVQYGQRTDLVVSGASTQTQYFDTLSGATEWDKVNSVRLWLLARNSTTEPGYENATVYQMGDQSVTASDNFRRQLFTTVVQLRN